MRIGLVLGAGGVKGGAWLTGGLDALAEQTGWDPAERGLHRRHLGGSMIGALLASGVPPWFMVAHSRGETFEGVTDAQGRAAADADRSGGAVFRIHRGFPGIGPGSFPLLLRTITRPEPPHAGGGAQRLAATGDRLDRASAPAGAPGHADAAGALTPTCG